jgi:hypothetical protein
MPDGWLLHRSRQDTAVSHALESVFPLISLKLSSVTSPAHPSTGGAAGPPLLKHHTFDHVLEFADIAQPVPSTSTVIVSSENVDVFTHLVACFAQSDESESEYR